MSTDAPQAAQPPAEGGDGAQGAQENGSPFAAVLEAVPQGREAVEAALKKVEGGITQRFQEAADFRKQWEPYADLGLSEVPADQLSEQIALGRLLADPASVDPEQVNADALSAAWEKIGDHFGFWDDQEPGGAPATPGEQTAEPAVQQALDELRGQLGQLMQQVGPVLEGYEAQQSEQRVQAADQAVGAALDKLEAEHPGQVNRDLVYALAYPHADQGPEKAIELAFRDSQRFTGDIERGMVETKTNGQPTPAAGDARPDTTPQPISTFEDAKKAARQRLAAQPGT